MDNVQFTSTIQLLCKSNGITISTLLDSCSLRKSFIYDVEKRNSKPSVEIIEAIADYLNCSVDYLLGRANTPDAIHASDLDARNGTTDYIMTTSKAETSLVIDFRSMNMHGQEYVLQTAAMAKNQYKKSDSLSEDDSTQL